MLSDIFIDFQDDPRGRIAIGLVYSGCKRAMEGHPCVNCQNPHLWYPSPSHDKDPRGEELYNITYEGGGKMIDSIVVFGGEPFDQCPEEILRDISHVEKHLRNTDVVVYTGYKTIEEATLAWRLERQEEVAPWDHPLLARADWVKMGEYDENIPPLPGSQLASGNQKMFRVIKSETTSPYLKEVFF
jgi:organic radical activating enzyme